MGWLKRTKEPRRRLVYQANAAQVSGRINPFKPEVPASRKPLILGIIAGVSALGVGGLVLFHPAFRIDVISITGATRTDYAELQKTARQVLDTEIAWVIPGSNYFLLNQTELAEIISTRFKLQSVEITKTFPHTLDIAIVERGPQLITIQEGIMMALDPDGAEVSKLGRLQTALSSDLRAVIKEARLVQKSSADLYKTLPLVVMSTVSEPVLAATATVSSTPASTTVSAVVPSVVVPAATTTIVANMEIITGVLAWNSFLKDNTQSVDFFVINSHSEGEAVLQESGVRLLINFTENRDRQFLAASTFWKQNKTTSTIQYLDLRYPGKIFWK